MSKPFRTGIAVFDLHHDKHDRKLWSNILQFASDTEIDYFVLGGDNQDMVALSHWLHEKGQKRQLEGRRIKEEYSAFQRDIIDPIDLACPNAEKVIMEGNHERWASQAIDKNPQGEGYWEPENNLRLDGWKKIDYGKTHRIGKMYFSHGIYTNQYHARKMVDVHGKNIFYGHMHTAQSFARITPIDNEAHIGVSVPCACSLNPEYRKDMPNAWMGGFLVFYVLPNGNFNAYTVIATKGSFVLNGKLYN